MRIQQALIGLLSWSAVLCWTSAGAKTSPVQSRLAEQNALFEEQYESDLKARPEAATSFGDYRYNDQLSDVSIAGVNSQHGRDLDFLKRLNAISTAGFREQDVLSHQVMARALQQRIADYDFKEYEMPVSQMSGPHVRLADLPLAVPLDSVKQYGDYLSRLHQIPRVFAQTEEVLRAGKNDQLMPVRFLLEKVPAQCLGVIAADPFLLPTRKYPSVIPQDEQRRLTKEITAAVVNEVLPAYLAFATFISEEYAPSGRSALSVTTLPGGEKRYLNDIRSRTTLSKLTPDQIHQIGLREIDRIEAEMLAIAKHEGFADLAAFRAAAKDNSKYRPASSGQIVEDFRRYIAQMQPKLPQLFGFVPGSPVTVEPMPDFEPGNATHYQTGTPDGKRPGRVVVAVANFGQRSLIDDEAVAYHEGVPGHHMQLSVAQTLPDLPKFRQHGGNSGYVEGWALYTQQMMSEEGFMDNSVELRLTFYKQLLRSIANAILDIRLQTMGMTDQQALDLMINDTFQEKEEATAKLQRAQLSSCQLPTYFVGLRGWLDIREEYKKRKGSAFTLSEFHDAALKESAVPLPALRQILQ